MTPLHLKPHEVEHLKRNIMGQGKARKKRTRPDRITIHVADDVQPETLAALATLAARIMEMGEDELREFIKKVRKA